MCDTGVLLVNSGYMEGIAGFNIYVVGIKYISGGNMICEQGICIYYIC